MNLLVVDWDYFFPNKETDPHDWPLWDWGHSEGHSEGLLRDILWPSRAFAFWRSGMELPQVNEELAQSFWSRFTIAPRAQLFYADSNRYAAHERVMRYVTNEVWLFDAHHDSGYRAGAVGRVLSEQNVTCEDWMIAYDLTGCALHVRYPKWRGSPGFEEEPEFSVDIASDDEEPMPNPVFDRVFVCRSGTWVPPWTNDARFMNFIAHAPVQKRILLGDLEARDWDEPTLRDRMNQENEAFQKLGFHVT
jgi:hypothetical protein